ncbi:cytochrome C [Sulfurospirillum sp. 1307]|jgi:hypothetical protein
MLKRLLTLLFAAVVSLSFVSTTAFAGVAKGQKIFIKKLKKPCGFTGGVMAKKHTQAEWKALNEAGKINEEIVNICPKAKPLKDKYVTHVYQFLYNYASDSGNVPS